jgi:hypothetical protein
MSFALRAFPAQKPAVNAANVTILNNEETPDVWTEYDASAVVGARTVKCIFEITTGQNYSFGVRPNGSTANFSNGMAAANVTGNSAGTAMIECSSDSAGKIQYKGHITISGTTLKLIGFIV